jgi:hypothetical protein
MGDRRVVDPGVAQILDRAVRLEAERDRRLRSSFLRSETMVTMMLGTTAFTLALVMLTVSLMGLWGIPNGSLTTLHQLVTRAPAGVASPGSTEEFDPVTGRTSYVLIRPIWLLSNDGVVLSLAGFLAGGLGILISVRRRKFSWLSAVGFALIVLTMLLVAGSGMVLPIRP